MEMDLKDFEGMILEWANGFEQKEEIKDNSHIFVWVSRADIKADGYLCDSTKVYQVPNVYLEPF